MSALSDLGAKLNTDLVTGGFWNGTTGNLGLDFRPPAPDVFYALYSTVSTGPDDVMGGGGMPYMVRTRIQFSARDVPYEYTTPRGKCVAAQASLTSIINTTIGGTAYYRVETDGEPFLIGRDDQERCLFVVNFTVIKQPS